MSDRDSAESAKRKLEIAYEKGPDVNEMVAAEEPLYAGIPVSWHSGSRDNAPAAISEAEVKAYSDTRNNHFICGNCKHFDLKTGQREMIRQRFAERLVHDEQWKLQHLGAPLDTVGLCGDSGGELATTFVTKGCENFRERVRSRR